MRNILKKIFAVFAATTLVCSMTALAACSDKSEVTPYVCSSEAGHIDVNGDGKCDNCQTKMYVAPEKEVTADDLCEGYFTNDAFLSYNAYLYVHLFPSGYCTIASMSVNGTYKYKVIEEAGSYTANINDTNKTVNCAKQLAIYNLDGSEATRLGYDSESKSLYGDENFCYNLGYAWNPEADYGEDTTFLSYKVVGGTAFNTFAFGADGSFTDETGDTQIKGTFVNSGNAYILTAADGTEYNLISTSANRATLTAADGTVKTLYIEQEEKTPYQLKGSKDSVEVSYVQPDAESATTQEGAKLDVSLDLKVDKTGANVGTLTYEFYTSTIDESYQTTKTTYVTGTTDATWKMNEDWPAYDEEVVAVYIDASEDGRIEAQKVYLTKDANDVYSTSVKVVNIPAAGYTPAQSVDIDLSFQLTTIANLAGSATVNMGTDVAITENLYIYSDGTAKLNVAIPSFYQSMDYEGTWEQGTSGYAVSLAGGIINIDVTVADGVYTATVKNALWMNETVELRYEEIALKGTGNSSYGATVNLTLTVAMDPMVAELNVSVPDFYQNATYKGTISQKMNGETPVADTYVATLSVNGQDYTVEFTVNEGVYTATINIKDFYLADADTNVTLTYGATTAE